jgi:hypothetical protein
MVCGARKFFASDYAKNRSDRGDYRKIVQLREGNNTEHSS